MQQNMAVTSHIFNPKRDHLVIVRASTISIKLLYQINLPIWLISIDQVHFCKYFPTKRVLKQIQKT